MKDRPRYRPKQWPNTILPLIYSGAELRRRGRNQPLKIGMISPWFIRSSPRPLMMRSFDWARRAGRSRRAIKAAHQVLAWIASMSMSSFLLI